MPRRVKRLNTSPTASFARLAAAVLFFSFILLGPRPASGQVDPPPQGTQAPGEAVRLFLDCHAMGCFDLDYLRQEIPFVNWVRDRQDADVYLLVTSQGTGGGGSSSDLIFEGLERFEGMIDTLVYVSVPNASQDAVREGFARILKIGLMRFVGLTPTAEEIEIGLRRAPGGRRGGPREQPILSPEDDPWNFWVFRVSGNGSLSGVSTRTSNRFSGSFSADRVTEEWKYGFRVSSSYNETKYEYEEIDYTAKNIRRDHSVSGNVINALGEKWSAGLFGRVWTSTYRNFELAKTLRPVLEFSVFPYRESTRRSLTFQYNLEWGHYDYREPTIYFKQDEAFWTQSLAASLNFTQPWGSAYTRLEGGHHLEDIDLHHVSIFGGITLRLSRGLRLNVNGSYSRIRDLISVAAIEDATPEEILLQRRQLRTDYDYRTSIGLSYTFGSIFNNIVNPRIEGGGGIGEIFMFF